MSENIKDIYPLSPMQQGMLFHTLFAPESEVYTEQLACTFVGNLNIEAFKKAWDALLQRHDVLRSAFVWEDLEEPLQVVYHEVELPFDVQDWSNLPKDQQKAQIDALIDTERQKGFDLNEAPLMRIKLIRLNENEVFFLWSHHHLLFDGWGFAIILKELFQLYEGYEKNQAVHLPAARPFRDYIAWLKAQDMQKAEAFWRKKLAGFYAPTPLVVDRKTDRPGNEYPKIRREYGKGLSARAEQFTKQYQVTLNTLFQGALALILARYSSENDVLFGSTVSGRPTEIPGIEGMVGLFINTLPIRVQIDEQVKVKDWLQTLQLQNAEMRQYEYTPLVNIHKWSDVPGAQPLFEALLVFENYPVSETLSQSSASLQIKDVRSVEKTNYPLTIVTAPGQTLTLDIAYDANRFDRQTIERLHDHFERVMEQIVFNPQQTLADIELVNAREKEKLLNEWSGTKKPFPQDKTIQQLFEAQAAKQPQVIAVDFQDQTLTYQQLNQKANQLAHFLRQKGVKPETIVGISLNRSLETVIAALAVLKSGGAYLPIDPDYPQERIDYMIADSGIRLLITEDGLFDRFSKQNLQLISLWKDKAQIEAQPTDNPEHVNAPQNLAFIIYTSGSTGKPKGVMLQHRGMINFLQNMVTDFNLGPGKTMLQIASFSFDAAASEIFSALTGGATVQMIERETLLSIDKLVDFLNRKRVTTATFPPSLLTLLPEERLQSIETIISVGDVCPWELARRFKNKFHFVNGYGPTEGTIGAIWGTVDERHENDTVSAPIGRPIANAKIYLLDARLKPVPVGVPGEIHIGGAGVSRGYWSRPDLTAEKFIPDPFSNEPGARLYKTGDLARYLPDGQIEFIGRVDFQVKIRGFRIELGEIEAQILKHPAVKDAVVTARGNNPDDKYLVAYFVPEEGQSVDGSEIHEFIKGHLPEYMTPAAYVQMEKFPLTPNGKVNRRALPDPEEADRIAQEYVAPSTPEEELLASIWEDILKVERVGVSSNFFDLGGHSLLATQLVSRIRDAFDVEIPLKEIFAFPTVRQLSMRLQAYKAGEGQLQAPPIEKADRSGKLPLSFAQQRLWFLDQLQPGSSFYNIPGAVRLIGDLNVEALEKSLSEVVRRHETLRTTFDDENGKPFLVIHEAQPVKLPVTDLSGLPEEEQKQQLKKLTLEENRKPFDLKSGPLFRTQLIKLNEKEHVILLTMHHIISDGWSMGIFMQEIAAFYKHIVEGKEARLPELEIQYVDYAVWQQNWLKGETLQKELDFWKQTLGMDPPVLELPTDFPRPAVQTFNGKTISVKVDPQLSQKIKELSRENNVTVFMTLLAAFQSLLHRYSRQDEILVGSPIANRNRSETEKLIGFFVNNIVIKGDFSERLEFSELLQQIRENTLNAYAHQDVPFEQIVDALVTKREMSHSPLFQVMFVMQNLPEARFELPGLTMRSAEEEAGSAKFDLSLIVTEADDHFNFDFEFNTDLFKESTIRRMQQHLLNFLRAVTEDSDQPIDLINYLSEEELKPLLHDWNQTATPFDRHLCAHQKFEQWAQEQPQLLAVEHNGQTLSYEELNRKANKLAHYLRTLNIKPDDRVGICLERSLEMIVGIMAALKAGAAFLPLDPAYPDERLQYMIHDSQLKIVLTQQPLQERLQNFGAQTLALDSQWAQIEPQPEENLPNITTPLNLAYVIYTSGSTGKPKGTLLPHRGLLNLANEQRKAFNITAQSRVLQFSSLSFDASVWETVMALLNGAALILVDRQILASGDLLVQKMKEKGVTTVTLPPSVLAVFPHEPLPALKTIITAGEKCPQELVKIWGVGRQFVNAYGPTETTVCASMYNADPAQENDPPIGKAIGNFELYILDQNLLPVPVGVPGELCVGGVGLARGYLNRADLTAEKFVPDPFSGRQGDRLYRTGDLVRYLEDGNIQFLGRIDLQVKVRGFRIELGEIEAVLREVPQVKDVVVMAREDIPGDKRLVAYLVCDEPQPEISQIRDHLSKQLPDYMVPSAYVFLDAMPLTPNGKIDRRALPKPQLDRSAVQAEYIAPRNEVEEKLTQIVSELLNIEKVGIHDNFFELGGHSLLATQFMSRLRTTFGVEMPLIKLFEKPTVAGLAEEVEKAKQQPAKAAPQIKRVARERRKMKKDQLR
ncbi:amino acid adenylation domain-containing protein [Caldithrix abyssi]